MIVIINIVDGLPGGSEHSEQARSEQQASKKQATSNQQASKRQAASKQQASFCPVGLPGGSEGGVYKYVCICLDGYV